MEKKIESIFLELLKAGIWNDDVDSNLFPLFPDDWNKIYFMAVKQTVQGVVYDAVCRLPEELLPPMDLLLQWMHEVQNIENTYHKHFKSLNYLITRFQAESDVHPILEKGIGLASCYPQPDHRVSGDIDIFYGSESKCKEAVQLIGKWGMHVHEGENGESAFMLNDVTVENHGCLVLTHHVFKKKKLNDWIDAQMQQDNSLRQIIIDKAPITVLNPTLDIMLLVTHSLKHLLNEGIGLRQMCDVAVYLKKNSQIINGEELEMVLKMFGVYRWANLIFCFLVNILGLDEGYLPYNFKKIAYNSEKLLAEIWKSGNFGLLDERNARRPTSNVGGKIFTFKRIFRNFILFCKYAPGEASGWPLDLITTRFKEIF